MLVIKIELHSAITGKVTELGRTIIYNDGTGSRTRGNYVCKVGKKGIDDLREISQNPIRESVVKDYPRLSYNVWRLVIRALRGAFPEER